MITLYIIQELDEYHLMYNTTYIIFFTKGDAQQYVDHHNNLEGKHYYGNYQERESMIRYIYKVKQINTNFTLIPTNTNKNKSNILTHNL